MSTNLPDIISQGFFPTDPAAIAAAELARARIQSAYVMALRKPRNPDQARDRILHACKKPAFAEDVEFNKPVGGKQIKGPSIRFAELALKEWGNVWTETQIVYEDDQTKRIKLYVTDMETNLTHSREITLKKTVERKNAQDREIIEERMNTQGNKVYIVKATEDELHNKENALISKALRNEGLRLIPSDITNEAIAISRETMMIKTKEDPDTAKRKILDAFSAIGITPRDLNQYLKHSTEHISPIEIEELRGIYRAIKDGEARWIDYIQPSDVEQKTEAKTEALKERIDSERKSRSDKGQPRGPRIEPPGPPEPPQTSPITSSATGPDPDEEFALLIRKNISDKMDELNWTAKHRREFLEKYEMRHPDKMTETQVQAVLRELEKEKLSQTQKMM